MAKATKKTAATPRPKAAFTPQGMSAWSDLMTENLRFATDCYRHALDTQMAMARCRTPADWMTVQTEFCQQSMMALGNQTVRMFQMTTGAKLPQAAEIKSPFSRRYDDIPL